MRAGYPACPPHVVSLDLSDLSPSIVSCPVASFNTTHRSCVHPLEIFGACFIPNYTELYCFTIAIPHCAQYFMPSRHSRLHFVGGPMATPSSGLRRSYNCSTLLPGGKFLLCGTDVGDMVVYGCVEINICLTSEILTKTWNQAPGISTVCHGGTPPSRSGNIWYLFCIRV